MPSKPPALHPLLIVFISLSVVFVEAFHRTEAQAPGYDWLQFGGSAQHTSNNTQETIISVSNVKDLKRLFQVALPGVVDGPPLYLRSVKTPQGTKDLLFMATRAGDLLAVDAHDGTPVWNQSHSVGTCLILKDENESLPCFTTSIPAIDPSQQFIYSYGLDGYVHKHKVEDGSEIVGGAWPELVTLKPWYEKSSPGLTIATAKNGVSYLYIATSGYPIPYPGDLGDYQGHLTAINLEDGSQKVFNTLCSNQTVHFTEQPGRPNCDKQRSGIWGRGGVVYLPATDRIYLTTGNGDFAPNRHNWGNSVIALHPDGSGENGLPLDSYTPETFRELEEKDFDLAASPPLIVPAPAGSKFKYIAVQQGKDHFLRLLNLENLSGKGKPGHTGGEIAPLATIPFPGIELANSPALWVNPADSTVWVFVPTFVGFSAWQLLVDEQGNLNLKMQWKNGDGGVTPLIANNVLYTAIAENIRAFDPATGKQLWGDHPIGDIHWQSPLIANGMLYITDENANLTAYSINGEVTAPASP